MKSKADPIYIKLATMFSSVKVMGPPLSEKLVTLIAHLFNPEEAELCTHLSFMYPKTREQIARKSGRNPAAVSAMLEEMSQKRIIITIASRFMLYPLIPGIFEHLLRSDESGPWHVEYAELINDLIETGYLGDYFKRPVNAIRNIPVQQAVETCSYTADSDLVSEMIDSHTHFGVYHRCPCRNAMHITGHDCTRASHLDGCLTFGNFSLGLEKEGNGRTVTREEMRDIVADRWSKNLVFFTSNVMPAAQTAICTCCECCCRALKIHNNFSKNLVAQSHSVASVDQSLCTNCGICLASCNTRAHSLENRKHTYNPELCIGCGNCVISCRKKAITMKENKRYRPPSGSYTRLIANMLPPVLMTGAAIKLKRYFS